MKNYSAMIAGKKSSVSRKIGRKTEEWLKAKPRLIKIYLEKGITKCENCGGKYLITFHHRPKRSSQEAVHDFKHTRLLCGECHDFFEYNDEADKKLFKKPRGYKLENKIKLPKENTKSKKPEWQRLHKCWHCHHMTSMFLCHHCGEISIKK
jgi:hypothetical protein